MSEKTKKKRNWFIISLAAIFGLVIISFISIEITSQPSFCKTCHYMEPYYESWKASVHNDVTCTNCHFPPGLAGTIRGKLEGLVQVVNYVSSSYSRRKPWAEIEDASCLRSGCHETQKLNTDIEFKGVHFNHKDHLTNMKRGKKLRCTSCHSQIVQGDHIKVTETTCFLCHFKESDLRTESFMKKVSDCGNCHKWEKLSKEERSKFKFDHEFVLQNKIECQRCHDKVVVGDGFVPKENCFRCHWDNERLGRYDEVELIHENHIEKHKVECIQCHLPIQHKLTKLDPKKELECNTCHENMHHEQKALFTGENLDGLKGIENPMYTVGLDCSSCHIYHENLRKDSGIMRANTKSCESCHGKGYGRLLNMWREAANKKITRLKNNIKKTKSILSTTSGSKKNKAAKDIKAAEEIVHILNEGKAIHNVYYSSQLMNRGVEYLNSALTEMNAGFKFKVDKEASSFVSECRNCHIGIEDVTVQHNNKLFNHGQHLKIKGNDCYKCHSNKKKHGELVLTDQQCASCHHQQPDELDCSKCHTTEFIIQNGEFMGLDEPDIMFDSDVACVDCHMPNDKIQRPEENVCESCHDEEYTGIMNDWLDEYNEALTEVEKKFSQVKKFYPKGLTGELKKLKDQLSLIRSSSANSLHNHSMIMTALENISTKLDDHLSQD